MKLEDDQMRTVSGEPHPAPGVADMIDFAYAQEYNKATDVFNDLIGAKMSAALDQEKVAVANQIFNDVSPEEIDDEELSAEEELHQEDDIEPVDDEVSVEDDTDIESDEQQEDENA
ncbi:DNA polymerase V family protein [Alphaproteobacteria bacterium]|jgi:hypothetical protein|nr:DNA polymerase V family protein [Alphaproteobacteria bacterium]|tara:strand:- start:40 stop:387 length:348 start_codon:yes stop_codon:yes gene_type:complete